MLNSAELELGSVVFMVVAGLIASKESRLATRGKGRRSSRKKYNYLSLDKKDSDARTTTICFIVRKLISVRKI